jgi:hypothetical protein
MSKIVGLSSAISVLQLLPSPLTQRFHAERCQRDGPPAFRRLGWSELPLSVDSLEGVADGDRRSAAHLDFTPAARTASALMISSVVGSRRCHGQRIVPSKVVVLVRKDDIAPRQP